MRLPKWKFVAYGLTTVVTAVTIKSSSNSSIEVEQSVHIPLQEYFNNRGFAKAPGDAEFNTDGQSYPAQNLPSPGTYTSTKTNISYLFPGYQELNKSDNLLLVGQTLIIPKDNYFSIQLLLAGDAGTATGDAVFTYSDNSTTTTEIRTQSFFTFLSIYKGEIVMPSYYTNVSTNYNTTHIFEWISSLDPTKTLTSIEFPDTSNDTSRIHVFSMSLFKQLGIQVQNLRPTQKTSGSGIQTVELVVNNAGPEWISGEGVEISILAPGIKTVSPGKIKRLRPGDQKKVDVGIMGSAANVTAEVVFQGANINSSVIFQDMSFGLEKWTADSKSLTKHESPQWYNDAKFGIFIHWGVYAVPGWGNSSTSEVYAEWYGWYNRHRAADRADIYDYELRTYGPDLNYDDFFPNFTASLFDPKEWVDLFDEAGAKYFVLTSKHHDGFSLFDTQQTSNRSALHYGPHRDVFKEVFDAAKTYYPEMHRAGYYSMTEWWNPDFGPYGFAEREGNTSTTWPGILATNPYTGLTEPYIGHIPVNDYLTDLQLPQMNMLAYEYESEIMWCDTGGPNKTAEFAAAWYNWAAENGRQVVMNNRCGIAESDFDTPEYTTFSSVSERKWESNQGMDPFSYGYNRATPPSAYMNASKLITTLVDMVSKNGNLLLDIGPKADGTIDETEVATLREAGAWIKAHGEAIYNTTYWFTMAENEHVRFTQTAEAFYILSLTPPTETFILDVPLPILQGDSVSLIGFGNDTELDWEFYGSGAKITVPEELSSTGKYCWVVKIEYIS